MSAGLAHLSKSGRSCLLENHFGVDWSTAVRRAGCAHVERDGITRLHCCAERPRGRDRVTYAQKAVLASVRLSHCSKGEEKSEHGTNQLGAQHWWLPIHALKSGNRVLASLEQPAQLQTNDKKLLTLHLHTHLLRACPRRRRSTSPPAAYS